MQGVAVEEQKRAERLVLVEAAIRGQAFPTVAILITSLETTRAS